MRTIRLRTVALGALVVVSLFLLSWYFTPGLWDWLFA